MAVVIFDSVDNSCIKTLCCCLCLVSLWSPLLRTMLLCLLTPVTLLSWSHSELQWSPGAALLGHTWGATSHHQQPETAPSVRKSQRKNIYHLLINIFASKVLMIFIMPFQWKYTIIGVGRFKLGFPTMSPHGALKLGKSKSRFKSC